MRTFIFFLFLFPMLVFSDESTAKAENTWITDGQGNIIDGEGRVIAIDGNFIDPFLQRIANGGNDNDDDDDDSEEKVKPKKKRIERTKSKQTTTTTTTTTTIDEYESEIIEESE